jgi:hypothetical protein
MSNFTTTNNNSKAEASNDNNNEKIDVLWVMGRARVIRNEYKEIIGYGCDCDICTNNKTNDYIFTAEGLLEHRKMKAFRCPCGCGNHVCVCRGSIISHIESWHKENFRELVNKGLDPYKSWIIPDYNDNKYKLGTPNKDNYKYKLAKPDFEDKSPLEQGAMLLSMKFPKRVYNMLPSPSQSPAPRDSPVPFMKTPILNNTNKWNNINKPQYKPLNEVMIEQQNEENENENENDANEPLIFYAQKDYRKEKQCSYGINCIKKDRPFACPYNHDGKGDIIQLGTILTDDILCQYERPPFMRCHNGRCTKIHLEHRAEFIENAKKAAFEKRNNVSIDSIQNELVHKPVNSSIVSIINGEINAIVPAEDALAIAMAHIKLDEENNSSVVSLTNENINAIVPAIDALAIALAQIELDGTKLNINTDDEWETPKRRNKKHNKPVENNDDDEDSDDSTHELRNIYDNQNNHSLAA